MASLVDENGNPFRESTVGSLDMRTVNRLMMKMLADQMDARERWDVAARLAALRESCGAPNPPVKFSIGIRLPLEIQEKKDGPDQS